MEKIDFSIVSRLKNQKGRNTMKKIWGLSLILLLSGCLAVPKPVSFINRATWQTTTKDKVYNACLTSLQFQNFNIHPLGTSKESGLIIAEREPFGFELDARIQGLYRLQIMVSEIADNKIMLDINVKASVRETEAGLWGMSDEYKHNVVNNQVALDMEELFTQIGNMVGIPEYSSRITLHW